MNIEYCDKCDSHIDTDFNAEHFDEEVNGCEATFEEVDEIPQLKGTLEALNELSIIKE